MPVAERAPDRVQSLDTLRGVALCGIIVVNAPIFAGQMTWAAPQDAVDQGAAVVLAAGLVGKFFLIFSCLFGFGVSNALLRSGAGAGRYLRRLLGLFAFGAGHAVLLFQGDILMLYAVLGLVLWLVRNWPQRRLLGMAAGIYALAVPLQAAVLSLALEVPPPIAMGPGYLGGFAEVLIARLAELPDSLAFVFLFNGLPALSMFLLGFALGRAGLMPPSAKVTAGPWPRRAVAAGFAAGLAFAAAVAMGGPVWHATGLIGLCAVAPILSCGIALSVLRAAELAPRAALTRWLAAAGRGTLTGYILHSVLLGAVFYGWGLGLHGQLGLAATCLVALAVFAVIVAGLNQWQRWFRYGPDEWLLRSFADLEWKPMRRNAG